MYSCVWRHTARCSGRAIASRAGSRPFTSYVPIAYARRVGRTTPDVATSEAKEVEDGDDGENPTGAKDIDISGILHGVHPSENANKAGETFRITESERRGIRNMLQNSLHESDVSVIIDDDIHGLPDSSEKVAGPNGSQESSATPADRRRRKHIEGISMRNFVDRTSYIDSEKTKAETHEDINEGVEGEPTVEYKKLGRFLASKGGDKARGTSMKNIVPESEAIRELDDLVTQLEQEDGPEFYDERGRRLYIPDIEEENAKKDLKKGAKYDTDRIFPESKYAPNNQPNYRLGPLGSAKLRKVTRYVDSVRCKMIAGKGGDGAISFFPSKYVPVGPPSGGTGGRGANIYIEASRGTKTLRGVKTIFNANPGQNGSSKQMNGVRGEDLIIRVPVGTHVKIVDILNHVNCPPGETLPEDSTEQEVRDYLTRFFHFQKDYEVSQERIRYLTEKAKQYEDVVMKEAQRPRQMEHDLLKEGDRILIAAGGSGGYGNPFYHMHGLLASRLAGKGRPGDNVVVELEMQTLADAGLVGLPNAGKSTFVSAISNANPKIAPYAFTTLSPYLGTLQFDDCWSMTVADIPGIIEGAHRNLGLGHEFLRHIVRSSVLIYIVDLSGPDPCKDLDVLRNELEMYKTGLTNRTSIIVANKADKNSTVCRKNLELLRKHVEGTKVIPISAKERKNIGAVCAALRTAVELNTRST